jgi:hypothetical protein
MLKWGFSLIGLIILGSIVFLWLVKAPIMSSYLTQKMHVPVSLGSISMWPSETMIRDFQIRNPRGFKTKSAFKAEETHIQYRFKQLFGNPSEIDLINIDNVYLSIEFSNPLGTKNNWTAIGSKIPENPNRKQEVLIHKLVLTNVMVEIRGLGLTGAPQTKMISRMEFNEIDSQEGFPTKELIQQIFGGAGLQQYIKELFSPQKVLDKVLSPLKKFGVTHRGIEKSGIGQGGSSDFSAGTRDSVQRTRPEVRTKNVG